MDNELSPAESEMIPFKFENKTVRVAEIDGTEWWAAHDVAKALGYKNTASAIANHCKGVLKQEPLATKGGVQKVRLISEGDLWRLIINSNISDANRFEKWIFDEVLPSIRKKGYYVLEQKIAEMKKEIRQGEDRIWELERKAEDPRWMAIRNVRRYICARMYSLDKKCFESGEREYYIYENNSDVVVSKEEFIAQVAALFPEAKIKKVRGHWQFWGIGTR